MHIPGCQKNGTFHIGILKNRVIHILFVEKRGPIIYLAALKIGPFGTHIRTMTYIGSYRPAPPPSHPHTGTPQPPRDRESPFKPKTLHHFNVESTKMMVRCSSFILVRHTCSSCVYGSFWGIDAKYSKQKIQAWTKTQRLAC